MNSSRFGEIIIGMILLIVGFASLFNSPSIAAILVVMGLFFVAMRYGGRFLNNDSNNARPAYRPASTAQRPAALTSETPVPAPLFIDPPAANGVYKHALQAARNAGLDPDHSYVLPVDLGVMVYEEGSDPVLQRTLPLTELADMIQPYIQLRLASDAAGRIKFEITDENEQRVFVHEDRYTLTRGVNLISPAARLRVSNLEAAGDWTLRVYADNTLIAKHQIEWIVGTTGVVRRNMLEDGEISAEAGAEVRAMMAENRLDEMSLDELLAYQEDELSEKRAARR